MRIRNCLVLKKNPTNVIRIKKEKKTGMLGIWVLIVLHLYTTYYFY